VVTDRDIRDEVVQSLTEFAGDFNVGGIVRAIIDRYGLVKIDDIPAGEYWPLVKRFDVSDANE